MFLKNFQNTWTDTKIKYDAYSLRLMRAKIDNCIVLYLKACFRDEARTDIEVY